MSGQEAMTVFHVSMSGGHIEMTAASGRTGETSQCSVQGHNIPCISISFCAGADNSCVSRGGGAGIRTMANASLSSPGVITHTYDSALSPQIGQQIFLC